MYNKKIDLILQTNCLNDIIRQAECIHEKFTHNFMFEDLKTMNSMYKDLNTLNKAVYTAHRKVSDIYKLSCKLFAEKISNFRNTLSIIGRVNAPDSDQDTFKPVLSDKFMKQLITPDQKYEFVSPGIKIPITIIDDDDELPNCNIYFIKKFAQFAIKINGQVLRGNIGQIFTNKKSKHPSQKQYITKCKYGSQCHRINNNTCEYYHDVYDYNNYTMNTLDHRIKKKIHVRNFLMQDWIYSDEAYDKKNIRMKHIGSRNRLFTEIPIVPEIEIDRLKDMLIHDILVILAIYHNKT